jgi:hypothetical protein
MDLAQVQRAVAAVNPYYPNMLNWQQQGDIIKAIPKPELSERAFQAVRTVFKRLGGRYVNYQGLNYFELVLKKEPEESGIQKHISRQLHGKSATVSPTSCDSAALNRLQNQLKRLIEAGRQLVEA